MTVSTMRRLCWSPSGLPECGYEVYCNVLGPVKAANKDAAGHGFHRKALQQAGLWDYDTVEEPSEDHIDADDDDEDVDSSAADGDGAFASGFQGRKKKKKKAADREDLYALLGLQHVRWMATDKQLKDAYRKMALKHHPDKGGTGMSDGEKTRMEEHFKKIQSAFETLSDPAKRREFDSTDDFDDSLPTEAAPADFFTVFGAAFKRQSRWSVNKPVPDLGGEDADWQAVNRFYDFWYSFKSWREFPHPDEEDIEQAESREERRWIERYNAKLREKGKKDEQKRLRKFVDDAYRQDPRILAKKDEDRKARERRKQEKANARQREQEEAERKKREEEERIAAEQAAELAAKEAMKKQKQEEKKLLKRERARLRQICAGETLECSVARVLLEESDVEKLTGSLSREQLAALCDGLVAESLTDEARLALLQEALHGRQQEQLVAERQAAQQKAQTAEAIKNMAKMDHKKAMEAMGEWSQDELRMLDKALAKFPAGTRRRWEQVTDYVRTRPQAEVLLMVKELQGAGGARMLSQDWKANRKAKGYNRGLASEDQGTVRYDDDAGAKEPVASSSGSAAPDTSPAAAAPAPTAPEWSEEQELLLVRSLKTFGKDLPDRWDRVAAAVGKTKGQCMRHYKELREKFKAKKG